MRWLADSARGDDSGVQRVCIINHARLIFTYIFGARMADITQRMVWVLGTRKVSSISSWQGQSARPRTDSYPAAFLVSDDDALANSTTVGPSVSGPSRCLFDCRLISLSLTD